MEKQIEGIIDSFASDFDHRKLDLLDRILFSLLLKKEVLLLRRRDIKETVRIGEILARYFDYRGLILRRLLRKNIFDKGHLVKKLYSAPTRLVLLVTHNCQLKCSYCRVRKFPAAMSEEVLSRAIDLVFSSGRQDLQIQFFGGEPLLSFDLIKKATTRAERINKLSKRDLTFILTTNGILLDSQKVAFLKEHNFLVECSIDGEVEKQLRMRKAACGTDYYSQMTDNLRHLFGSGVGHYSISVVTPSGATSMFESFKYLVGLGFKRLQMNYSLGIFWPSSAIDSLLGQTKRVVDFLKKERGVEFVNLTSARREPVVLNAELTVDCDGGIYLESGICLEEDFLAMKKKFLITDVYKVKDINLYCFSPFQNFYRLSRAYAGPGARFRKIIINNILLGKRYGDFLNKISGASAYAQ